MMEDFESAFLQRSQDVKALDQTERRTAAMHFGGVAIECLLKSIICASLPTNVNGEKEWKTESNQPGHTYYNPGHDYHQALRSHNRLNDRVQKFPEVKKWLRDVENLGCHFINMRYLGNEPDDEKYKRWKKSYNSLLNWLQKQATQL